jgi:hypothetical protein
MAEDNITLTVGGIHIGAIKGSTYNDDSFHIMQTFFGVEESFQEGGTLDTHFSFENLSDGGGKGGFPMAFDASKQFLVWDLPNDTIISINTFTALAVGKRDE